VDAIEDPVERAAVIRLQQAIRRIQSNRARHAGPMPRESGSANLERSRDW
jgi:hypothetical protein